jgi:hypothetical protein
MAKQTFTTGQVLSAAQMTSLQQTAMGGGSTTAKTASYVLVASDAGTVVQMNSASATTITVNTALFAAGDTVQIQNVGAGVCTVTAGTATVNTSSTLSLKQYDAGSLYFNSTSAAIFFATDAADSTSPLTTKGDLYTFSTLDARLPVGTNNQILVADSTASTGLKWATPASGGFNTGYAYTAASESTTSTSFTNLTTATAVTVTTGTKALVSIKAGLNNNGVANVFCNMGFAVSGATTIAASSEYSNTFYHQAANNHVQETSSVFVVTGLTAGSNTFTTKYSADGGAGGTAAFFLRRSISVVDLGS